MTDRDAAAEVLDTAAKLVGAFGSHDVDAYFAHFAPDAQFLFHNVDHLLETRADYETLWRQWEKDDGFRVLACRSTDQHVKLAGDVAIFTHRVETTVHLGGEEPTGRERETIVFRRMEDGTWLGIHEHLSLEA